MPGSFFSGSREPEHRLTHDDLTTVRRCMEVVNRVICIAEAHEATGAACQLQQVREGLQSILNRGGVLLARGGGEGLRYEADG